MLLVFNGNIYQVFTLRNPSHFLHHSNKRRTSASEPFGSLIDGHGSGVGADGINAPLLSGEHKGVVPLDVCGFNGLDDESGAPLRNKEQKS